MVAGKDEFSFYEHLPNTVFHLREMCTVCRFSTTFSDGDNFHDFFGFLYTKPLWKRVYPETIEFAPDEQIIFFLESLRRETNSFDSIACLTSVPISPNFFSFHKDTVMGWFYFELFALASIEAQSFIHRTRLIPRRVSEMTVIPDQLPVVMQILWNWRSRLMWLLSTLHHISKMEKLLQR